MSFQHRVQRKFRSLLLNRTNLSRKILLRITNNFNWYFGPILGERSFPPEGIGLHLTKRCNLRCSMCFLWSDKKNPGAVLKRYKQEEMDSKRWFDIIDELAPYRPSIGLSGGESLVYEDVIEIIDYIKQKGMYCSINTNGMLLEKFAPNIIDSKMDMVRISIDGPPEIHDSIRGVPGCFSKLIRGIEAINNLKQKNKVSVPSLEVYFTITEQNLTYLTDVLELIETKNINAIKFIHPLYMNQKSIEECAKFLEENIYCHDMDYLQGANIEKVNIDTDKLIKEINNVKSRKNKIFVRFFPDFNDEQIKEYYTNHYHFALKFSGKCSVPWFSVNIKPDGKVESCPDYTIGNIRNEKFLTVWNNSNMRNLRKLVRSKGIIPICHGCCNLYREL